MVSSNFFSSFLALFVSFLFSNIPGLALFSVFSSPFTLFLPFSSSLYYIFSRCISVFLSFVFCLFPFSSLHNLFPSLHFSFHSQRFSCHLFLFSPHFPLIVCLLPRFVFFPPFFLAFLFRIFCLSPSVPFLEREDRVSMPTLCPVSPVHRPFI